VAAEERATIEDKGGVFGEAAVDGRPFDRSELVRALLVSVNARNRQRLREPCDRSHQA